MITTIRKSETAEAARKNLMAGFGLTQIQAQAILDMQLRRLANLERQEDTRRVRRGVKTIAYLEDLLANPRRILLLIKEEVAELKSKYGDARRTEIIEQGVLEFSEEDLIPHQRVVVTLSNRGFIKRVPSRTYTPQHRGGKGIIGMVTRESDAVRLLTVADTHDNLFFFTNRGKVFHLKCHEIPADSSRTAKGTGGDQPVPHCRGREGDGHGGHHRFAAGHLHGDGDPQGGDKEDVGGQLRRGAQQRAYRHGPGGGRRAGGRLPGYR